MGETPLARNNGGYQGTTREANDGGNSVLYQRHAGRRGDLRRFEDAWDRYFHFTLDSVTALSIRRQVLGSVRAQGGKSATIALPAGTASPKRLLVGFW